MGRKLYISLFAVFCAIFLSLSPLFVAPTSAFSIGDAAGCLKDQKLGCIGDAVKKISVPSIDVWGVIKSILNIAATTAAKKAVSDIVNSTITWANTGFEGNPAYVQNPKQFFLNSANSTAASFLSQVGNGKLGFLCSPFQKQIQLSLISYYYQPQNQALQCTWTGIAGNFQNFVSNNFSAGGWDGWFSMTQVPTNNIYGATVSAQIALSSQVQQTLGLKQQDYQVNKGFLNLPGDCLAHNPSADVMQKALDLEIPQTQVDYIDANTDPETVANDQNDNVTLIDTNKPAGACIFYGPTKTPGTIIQSGLEKTLGTGVDQLVNAQEFDQLASALMQGLLTRYVTGPKGLFGPHYKQGLPASTDTGNGPPDSTDFTNPGDNNPPPSQFSCSPIPSAVAINQPVDWHVQASGIQPTDQVSYAWTWSNGAAGTGVDRTISYTAPGTITGSVDVTLNGVTQTVPCDTALTVTTEAPPSVSCLPSVKSADPGTPVTWTASITGGSGAISSAVWEDTSVSPNGDTQAESFSPSVISGSAVSTSITYSATGSRTASVVVHDADPQYPPASAECTGAVQVGNTITQAQ